MTMKPATNTTAEAIRRYTGIYVVLVSTNYFLKNIAALGVSYR